MRGRSGFRQLLLPLTPVYRFALAIRELRLRRGLEPVRRLRFPIISVGNLSTGGAGKTPFVIALASALTARGYHVDVLSRGYGRKDREPARVDGAGTAEEFGDEPLLIARESEVSVYVAAQRYQAGLLAEADLDARTASSAFSVVDREPLLTGQDLTGCGETRSGAGFVTGHDFSRAETSPKQARALAPEGRFVHILDDAFQHRQLHRDLDILLLNLEDWHDTLLPAGNLREPLRAAFHADVIAIPEYETALESELRKAGWEGPVWRLRRRMEVPQPGGPLFAFCGIARPDQFFAGLECAGVRLAGSVAFRDHHLYTRDDVERLQSAARSAGAVALITTAKDEVRLAPLARSTEPGPPILTARLGIEIGDEDAVLDWIARRLGDTAARPSL